MHLSIELGREQLVKKLFKFAISLKESLINHQKSCCSQRFQKKFDIFQTGNFIEIILSSYLSKIKTFSTCFL